MTHLHEFVAHIDWTGAVSGPTSNYKTYARDYEISIDGHPVIPGSADPAFLGSGDRYNPEDMLVASLSACHLLSYLAVCARKGVHVTGYHDDAWGKMEMKDGALCFTEVILKPVVTITAESDPEKAARLHHDAHKICFIANSMNFPVLNKATIRTAS